MIVTCDTAGCANAGIDIDVAEPEDTEEWRVVCGVCGTEILYRAARAPA
jgi:hypothetical protein